MKMHLGLAVFALLALSCGHRPDRLGVTVNRVPYQRTSDGAAPANVSTLQFASPSSLQRAVRVDLFGDERPETIVERSDHHGVDVQDQSGSVVGRLSTTEYLTDFGVLNNQGERLLVLYTYPNASGGGTFLITTLQQRETARWTEQVPPARFAAGTWQHLPAVFYLQQDRVTIRSVEGAVLASLDAPSGRLFSQLFVGPAGRDRLVIVASGSGYTPYHMVCVYDAGGQLVFQEIANEHAFALESGADVASFEVVTRSTKWRYLPAAAATP